MEGRVGGGLGMGVHDVDEVSPSCKDGMIVTQIDLNTPMLDDENDGMEGRVSVRNIAGSIPPQSQSKSQLPSPSQPLQPSPNPMLSTRANSITRRSFRPPSSPTKLSHRRGSKSSQIHLLASSTEAAVMSSATTSPYSVLSHYPTNAINEYLQMIVSGMPTPGEMTYRPYLLLITPSPSDPLPPSPDP